MKKIVFLWLAVLLLISCSEEIVSEDQPIIRKVNVMEVTVTDYIHYATYHGSVATGKIVQMAFQIPGTIALIDVQQGDYVSLDDLLGTLETEGYQLALEAAQAEYNGANAQLQKAIKGRDFAKKALQQAEAALQQGQLSGEEYGKMKLNYDLAQDDVNGAYALREQGRVNMTAKEMQLTQTKLLSPGTYEVFDVLKQEGDLTAAGYPVVLLRSRESFIQFGITVKDYKKIEVGDSVEIQVGDEHFKGRISEVALIPDQSTMTYSILVQSTFDGPIGQPVKVEIKDSTVEGAKIPLQIIRTDGDDYVFIVENDHVVKRHVQVLSIDNQLVVVKGLKDGDLVVVEGMQNVVPGDEVEVVK